jgi:hypothetical protein
MALQDFFRQRAEIRLVFRASVPSIFERHHLRQAVIHCLGLRSDLSPMIQGPGEIGKLERPGRLASNH